MSHLRCESRIAPVTPAGLPVLAPRTAEALSPVRNIIVRHSAVEQLIVRAVHQV